MGWKEKKVVLLYFNSKKQKDMRRILLSYPSVFLDLPAKANQKVVIFYSLEVLVFQENGYVLAFQLPFWLFLLGFLPFQLEV